MLPKLKAKNFLIRPCTVSKCLVSKKKNKVHTLNVNYPSVAGGNQIKYVYDNETVLSSFTEDLICAKVPNLGYSLSSYNTHAFLFHFIK